MILHFITDDKFADYAIKQFAAPEMQSRFVLITYGDEIQNIKLRNNVSIIKAYSADFTHLLTTLGEYSAIVLHGLFSPWDEMVLKNVPDKVKVAWMFWGGEIYGRRDIKNSFLAPWTKLLRRLRTILTHKVNSEYELPLDLYQRIDYCLTDMEEEFLFMRQYTTNSRVEHLWYNYYSIEETIGALVDCGCSGNNVWFGNSCTLENNHLDAMIKLRHQLGKKKLIVPLSYGEPWLRNIICKIGRLLFQDCFTPLVNFMPLAEYNKLMLECNTMIQPHFRPQAQGNIITGLWLGMRVYLSERSMTYQYFKRIGCLIYSLENDFKAAKDPFAPLTKEQIEYNRTILRQSYDIDRMQEKNKEIVKILTA